MERQRRVTKSLHIQAETAYSALEAREGTQKDMAVGAGPLEELLGLVYPYRFL